MWRHVPNPRVTAIVFHTCCDRKHAPPKYTPASPLAIYLYLS